MSAALRVIYLASRVVQAFPISEFESPHLQSVRNIASRTAPNNCDNIRECRTIWDIIWSCLATTFACTWLALHLNIPGPDDGWLRIAFRKVGIMLLAVIAPEIVVAWAVRQWLVARRMAFSALDPRFFL